MSDVGVDDVEEPKRVRINLWVPPSTYKFLDDVSRRDGRSMSDVIRASIRDYMVKDANEREQLGEKK